MVIEWACGPLINHKSAWVIVREKAIQISSHLFGVLDERLWNVKDDEDEFEEESFKLFEPLAMNP